MYQAILEGLRTQAQDLIATAPTARIRAVRKAEYAENVLRNRAKLIAEELRFADGSDAVPALIARAFRTTKPTVQWATA